MRCGDCRFWEPTELGDGFGWCDPVMLPDPHQEKRDGILTDDASTEVGQDFGCIHFEQKK